MSWDPDRYLEYADERGRPFLELVARIGASDPAVVVDLGCGAGNLTRLLRDRWPRARVLGVDSSPEMVERARREGLEVEEADLAAWRPAEPVDVVVSNAALQWVPGHLELLPDLVRLVRPGGWLAFQVPGNFDQPSHSLRRELATDARFAPYVLDVAEPAAFGAEVYLARLQALGCAVDAWETTYLHVLGGHDAVFRWVSGTGARPMLDALPEGVREEFAADLSRLLRQAYPEGRHGTVLPFRRVFVVARTGVTSA